MKSRHHSILGISFFFTILFSTAKAQNEGYKPHFNEKQKYKESRETVLFFNHPTSFWDHKSTAKEGVRQLRGMFSNEDVASFMTVHSASTTAGKAASQYYLDQNEVDKIILSAGGNHSIHFSEAKQILFAGGNLPLCLCRAFRDSLRHLTPDQKIFEGIFVEEAIYEGNSAQKNLAQIIADMSDTQVLEWIDRYVFGSKSSNQSVCPGAFDLVDDIPLTNEPYTFELFRHGKSIGTRGTGPRYMKVSIVSVKDL